MHKESRFNAHLIAVDEFKLGTRLSASRARGDKDYKSAICWFLRWPFTSKEENKRKRDSVFKSSVVWLVTTVKPQKEEEETSLLKSTFSCE
jgi:hypothetical protein